MNLYAPVPNFDQPIDALYICHDNILRRMQSIRHMVDQIATEGSGAFAGQIESWREIFSFIDHSIANHTRDEEEGLFPMLRDSIGGPVQEMLAQHDWAEETERWLRERFELLIDTEAGNAAGMLQAFTSRATELARFYEDHIALENETIFPEARRALAEEQLAELGGLMRAHRRLTIDLPAGL